MNNIEQKARELLASEYERDGFIETAYHLKAGYIQTNIDGRALRAIIVALTQQSEAVKQRDFLVEEYERAVKCGQQGYIHCAMHLFNAITNAQIDARVTALTQQNDDSAWINHPQPASEARKSALWHQCPHCNGWSKPAVQQDAAPKVSEEDLARCERGAGICEDDGSYGIAVAIRRVIKAVRGRQ